MRENKTRELATLILIVMNIKMMLFYMKKLCVYICTVANNILIVN